VHPLETYLKSLAEIRASAAGTKETSYYPAFHALLNEAGSTLKPKVRCILQLANRGAGNPDGGLYTAEQFQKLRNEEPTPGQKPARGAIEIKAPKDDAWVTAASEQATKYWREYGQVLVSNYRDFVLIGRDAEGKPLKLASYRLAPDEKSFWKLAAQPHKCAKEQGERFLDLLKLAMLSPAILTEPKDVAWVLAYYAREAKFRIEGQAELEALAAVREALEQALGLKFEGEKGEHFFRSSLVQTLFYGVFSAWVLWSKQHPPASKDKFDWKLAQWSLRVPMIRALFEQVATPGQLGALGLVEVLDWTAAALNRVNRGEFFAQFQEQEAVQYFYEPFLEAFDPELRKELGVWYTPLEIVKYMVARTDRVLREELGLEDGLADENVYVLDPGCGTGAYLVEVLKTIAATLKAKGDDALAAQAVKQAARERVFGFEILPAPFVISHLQLGLLLQNLGAPLAEKGGERVGVFLTNSLTGWEPPKGPKQHLIFPEMEAERDLAENVKQDKPILVVIGNPPYNAFAGVSPAEEEGLVEPYKEGLISEWGIKKFNLDDLYVRFFRLAERRIAEKTGKGVVCYISNFSYLGGPSFVVMRRRFLEEFDRLWFDCMNGDSRETGKVTPDGKPDPSVFSTQMNPEGIRVGTAVGLMVRGKTRQPAEVRFRNFWGTTKRTDLLNSLACEPFEGRYEKVESTRANRFSFRPGLVTPEYRKWPKVTELCLEPPYNGPVERRGLALISMSREDLFARLKGYFDPEVSDAEVKQIYPSLMMTGNRIVGTKARKKLLKETTFDERRIVRYPFKPFDVRWCYLDNIRPLFSEPSPRLLMQRNVPGQLFFLTRDTADKSIEGSPLYISPLVADYDFISGHTRHFPIAITDGEAEQSGQMELVGARRSGETARPNLSDTARKWLLGIGASDDIAASRLLWLHAAAVGNSGTYLRENEDGIRQDWPRVPLPASKDLLLASAALGEELAALLNTEAGVHGVTSGKLRAEMKVIGNVSALGGKTLDASELNITAGWGHGGKDGATMPGKGKLVERDYTESEREAIAEGAKTLGLTLEEALAQLGETTCDVYLNENAYWRNVPSRVWEYTIGGYQVMKKWLSYREAKLLGRPITPEEAHYVRDMARRIAGICLLQPKLDGNYAAVKANAYVWGERAAAPNTETAKQ
jgi:SAM-dependent methyltransferase